MKGYFRKRGDKWSFTVDIGIDPATGKRRQKARSGSLPRKLRNRLARNFSFS